MARNAEYITDFIDMRGQFPLCLQRFYSRNQSRHRERKPRSSSRTECNQMTNCAATVGASLIEGNAAGSGRRSDGGDTMVEEGVAGAAAVKSSE